MDVNLKNVKKVKFITDFKEFISRGNVIDMAVGVIIGGAFGKIVTSLVNDIVMPLVGLAMGGINLTKEKFVLTPEISHVENGEKVIDAAESSLCWGNFLQTTIDFLIIAFCIFVAIRLIEKLKRKKKETEVEDVPANIEPSEEVKLLREIRDLLKDKN